MDSNAFHQARELRQKFSATGLLGKAAATLVALIVLALIGLVIFRLLFVTSVDNYHNAYRFERWGENQGKIIVLQEKGWIIAWPVKTSVQTVDLRPMQVCINANARILNCKLVEFNPAGLELFLSWHCRDNYEGPGNASSSTTNSSMTKLQGILMSYAYDGTGTNYPFLHIIRELKPEEVR